MEDASREKRRIMLGELLEHMEGAQEVASGLAQEHPEYAEMAEAAGSAADMVSMACELEAYSEPESYSYDGGEGGEQMQGPWGGEVAQGIDGYEQMVNTFTEQAKTFLRSWGPVGEPMVMGIEAWAQMQHAYIKWLRQTLEAGGGRP